MESRPNTAAYVTVIASAMPMESRPNMAPYVTQA
jgi:hypothetical protein